MAGIKASMRCLKWRTNWVGYLLQSELSTGNLIGLLLLGGQSTRMGTDKATLNYQGKPHAAYLFELLQGLLPESYVSLRSDQSCDFTKKIIVDSYPMKGPINGILSAMNLKAECAFLVLAVDLPFLKSTTLERLIRERDPQKLATVYCNKETGLPEPLIAIWEPAAKAGLEDLQMKSENNSLRGFLLRSNIKCIDPIDPDELFNANTSVEFKKAKSWLK